MRLHLVGQAGVPPAVTALRVAGFDSTGPLDRRPLLGGLEGVLLVASHPLSLPLSRAHTPQPSTQRPPPRCTAALLHPHACDSNAPGPTHHATPSLMLPHLSNAIISVYTHAYVRDSQAIAITTTSVPTAPSLPATKRATTVCVDTDEGEGWRQPGLSRTGNFWRI